MESQWKTRGIFKNSWSALSNFSFRAKRWEQAQGTATHKDVGWRSCLWRSPMRCTCPLQPPWSHINAVLQIKWASSPLSPQSTATLSRKRALNWKKGGQHALEADPDECHEFMEVMDQLATEQEQFIWRDEMSKINKTLGLLGSVNFKQESISYVLADLLSQSVIRMSLIVQSQAARTSGISSSDL